MIKKILSILLVCVMALSFFVACKDNKKKTVSSESEVSATASEENSDASSKKENSSSKKTQTSSNKTSGIQTQKPTFSRPDGSTLSNSSSPSTSSATQSVGIKQYKNRPMIGTYHLSFRWCDYYGTDNASREKQFREVVKEGYFNTYFLHAQSETDINNLYKEIEIIAQNGATFWFNMNKFNSKTETIEQRKNALAPIINKIKQMGYWDYCQGIYMDEPIWNGQSNADFLAETELYYNTFGLRTFPVFATGEFSSIEGNLSTPGTSMGKIHPDAMKYVTDVGFDSYGVDVRDSGTNGAQSNRYAEWTEALNYPVNNGRDYYLGYKKMLKERVGHEVSWWYFPTAFEWKINNGGRADEDYCIGHVKYMAEDMLKEKNAGGIALYTYYMHKTHNTVAMAQHLDVCDSEGYHAHFLEYPKWYDFSDLLRETRKKFDTITVKKPNINA